MRWLLVYVFLLILLTAAVATSAAQGQWVKGYKASSPAHRAQ